MVSSAFLRHLEPLKSLAWTLPELIMSRQLAQLKMAECFKGRVAGDDQNSFLIFLSDVLGNSSAIL